MSVSVCLPTPPTHPPCVCVHPRVSVSGARGVGVRVVASLCTSAVARTDALRIDRLWILEEKYGSQYTL